MSKNEKIKVASVLSFEKKLVPSDAFFYGTCWDQREEAGAEPLALIEKSVRGTISNRLKSALAKDTTKLDAEVEKANLQRVDACALGAAHDTLKMSFTLKVLNGLEHPSACNSKEFLASYRQMVTEYVNKFGFSELARRYAHNIANGRFLWRNRVGAEKVEVRVTLNATNDAKKETLIFDAKSFCINDNFKTPDNKETATHLQKLADYIANALEHSGDHFLIQVDAYALMGKAQEVYPSEELVLDKNESNKEKKSKILYAVNGTAAMHSQKVGNALRTIDTWYPNFKEHNAPIAIEPYGAVTNLGRAFRTPKDKQDFFTLFDAYATGGELERDDQKHYVMAVLIRGGVFGQSGKE